MAASNYMLLAVACAGLWCQALGTKGTERQRSRIVKEILEQRQLTYPDGPVGNESAPVVVTFDFNLISINNVDESRGVLELTAYLPVSWNDSRVSAAFDSSCDEDVSHVAVPADGLWTPDIELYDASDIIRAAPGMKFLNRKDQVVAHRSGMVSWVPHVYLSAPCVIDPSSTSICALKFGSWVHNGNEMDIALRTTQGDISQFHAGNPSWELNDMPTLTLNRVHYSCCPEPYVDVVVTISLRRKDSRAHRGTSV